MRPLHLILLSLALGCGGASNPAREAVDATKAVEPTPTAPVTPATPQAPTTAEAAQVYTCPMHPEVQQAGPGTCPTCKMALVPKGS